MTNLKSFWRKNETLIRVIIVVAILASIPVYNILQNTFNPYEYDMGRDLPQDGSVVCCEGNDGTLYYQYLKETGNVVIQYVPKEGNDETVILMPRDKESAFHYKKGFKTSVQTIYDRVVIHVYSRAYKWVF